MAGLRSLSGFFLGSLRSRDVVQLIPRCHTRVLMPRSLWNEFAVVIGTVVAKHCDHLPLYRQQAILEREEDVEISRATLDGWVMRVGELLQPIVAAMRRDLLRASYLQADETTVPVQMNDKRGADHQAYLWQYGSP